MAYHRLLSLIHSPELCELADLSEVAAWVSEASPSTLAVVLPDAVDADATLPDLPALTVSFAPLRRLRPRRGPLLQGEHVPKSAEYRALTAAGIPVPRWARVLPGLEPDLSGFGLYVVTKPDFGARGADVRLERREHVRWTGPRTELAARFGGHFNPRLAQELVYTGPWPRSHRVASLLGRALFALTIEADHARQPLLDRTAFHGQSIVSSGRGCRFELCHDRDVIELAERAHAAAPHVPLLGVDVLRDAESGALYVVELNSIGYTWHFSSPSGRRFQREFGLNLAAQLDGRRRAASLLAEACVARAR